MAQERDGRFVGTVTGERFYPFDPRPSEVNLTDVAHGLAHTCRYAGQCRFYYSVGLHSLHVSSELEARGSELALYGLLHDAGETYLGDVPAPAKERFPAFETAEERILDAVWTAFDLDPPDDDQWAAVMDADLRLRRYEMAHLLPVEPDEPAPDGLDYDLRAASPAAVRDRFVDRAEQLLARV